METELIGQTKKEQVVLAQTLYRIMDRLKLDRTGMATLLQVPPTTLRKWMNCERMPTASARRLIEVVDIVSVLSPDLLLEL